MEQIPKEDLDNMDMDEVMSDNESEEDGDENEEEEDDEKKEMFIPGKHELAQGEELVRDERFNMLLANSNIYQISVHILFIMNFKLARRVYRLIFLLMTWTGQIRIQLLSLLLQARCHRKRRII